MCIYFYYVSLKICAPSLFLLLSTIFSTDQKAYHRRQNPFPTRNFLGDFEPTVLSFFLPSWLSASQNRPLFRGETTTREYLFSVSHTSSVSSLFASRDASTSTIRTYTHAQHNSSKMFSLTQSASFCAGAKVNVAAQKKQQSKISRSIQAGKAISSESLSKRDFLSAAVLSFGFLSVGDANAATKRVRKSSSAAAVKKSPAGTKKSAAKPAYKPKGKTVVPAPSVATSPASRRGRRGVPIAGKSSSVSAGKRKTRSPAQARKGKY